MKIGNRKASNNVENVCGKKWYWLPAHCGVFNAQACLAIVKFWTEKVLGLFQALFAFSLCVSCKRNTEMKTELKCFNTK